MDAITDVGLVLDDALDLRNRPCIYHLFGLSKARLFLRSTLTAMGIALTAALLFGVALYQGLTYMPDSDLTVLLIGTTAGFVLFSLILNWAGYCGTAARLGKGGR